MGDKIREPSRLKYIILLEIKNVAKKKLGFFLNTEDQLILSAIVMVILHNLYKKKEEKLSEKLHSWASKSHGLGIPGLVDKSAGNVIKLEVMSSIPGCGLVLRQIGVIKKELMVSSSEILSEKY